MLKRIRSRGIFKTNTTSKEDYDNSSISSEIKNTLLSSPLRKSKSMNFSMELDENKNFDISDDSFDPFEHHTIRKSKSLANLSLNLFNSNQKTTPKSVHFEDETLNATIDKTKAHSNSETLSSSDYSDNSFSSSNKLQTAFMSINDYKKNENQIQKSVSELFEENETVNYFNGLNDNPVNENDIYSQPKALDECESNLKLLENDNNFAPNYSINNDVQYDAKVSALKSKIFSNLSFVNTYESPLSDDLLVYLTYLEKITAEISHSIEPTARKIEKETNIENLMLSNEVATSDIKEFLRVVNNNLNSILTIKLAEQSKLNDDIRVKLQNVEKKAQLIYIWLHDIYWICNKYNINVDFFKNEIDSKLQAKNQCEQELGNYKLCHEKLMHSNDELRSSNKKLEHNSSVEHDLNENLQITIKTLESDKKTMVNEIYEKEIAISNLKNQIQQSLAGIGELKLQFKKSHEDVIIEMNKEHENKLQEIQLEAQTNKENEAAQMKKCQGLQAIIDKQQIQMKKYEDNLSYVDADIRKLKKENEKSNAVIVEMHNALKFCVDSNNIASYCLNSIIKGINIHLCPYYDQETQIFAKNLLDRIKDLRIYEINDLKLVSEFTHIFQSSMIAITDAFARNEIMLEEELKAKEANYSLMVNRLTALMEDRLKEVVRPIKKATRFSN